MSKNVEKCLIALFWSTSPHVNPNLGSSFLVSRNGDFLFDRKSSFFPPTPSSIPSPDCNFFEPQDSFQGTPSSIYNLVSKLRKDARWVRLWFNLLWFFRGFWFWGILERFLWDFWFQLISSSVNLENVNFINLVSISLVLFLKFTNKSFKFYIFLGKKLLHVSERTKMAINQGCDNPIHNSILF